MHDDDLELYWVGAGHHALLDHVSEVLDVTFLRRPRDSPAVEGPTQGEVVHCVQGGVEQSCVQ